MGLTLTIMSAVLIFLGFMFGGSLASFAGVVVERVPKGETILGTSHCVCGRPLKWYENIPVFGWLAAKGKTSCCNQKLPVWYFISELATGTAAALVVAYLIYG